MNFTNIKSPNRMNTNRNIPYNYNVKDIDWPGLKAVGISKEQLEADGNLDQIGRASCRERVYVLV